MKNSAENDEKEDEMLSRWVPAIVSVSSISCGKSCVSEGKFGGKTGEFSGVSEGNFGGFLGVDLGSVSGGTFLGGYSHRLNGRCPDLYSGGFSGFSDISDIFDISVNDSGDTSVEPAGFVFCLEALGALKQRKQIDMSATACKKKKDKIRPLDQATDGEGTGGDPEYLAKCEKSETYQSGPFDM